MTTNFPKPLDKQVAAISDSLSQTQDGLAIVANGNTHAAISSGQFVYVKGHDTLPEGLHKATSAIAANGTLSTSNLTPDGSGGLNDLQGQLTTLNSKIGSQIYANITSSNIGSYTTTGFYNAYFENSIIPTAGWGSLEVFNTANTIVQIIACESALKIRRYYGNTSTWGSWTDYALNSNITRQDVTSLLTNVLPGASVKVYKIGSIVEVIAHSQGNSVGANNTLVAAKLPSNMLPLNIGITEPSGTNSPGKQTGIKINSSGEILFINNTSSAISFVQGIVMFMI